MLKKILGAVSPAYGILTGKGAMGKAASKGLLGALPRAIAKDAQKSGGKSGSAEPEEGAPETGRPRGRGFLGRLAEQAQQQGGMPMSGDGPRGGGMMGRIPMAALKSKSMRGASTQGMKSGGKVKNYRDGGIYTADMGQPPQDIDGGSAPMKKPMPKKSEAKKPATKLRGEGVRKMPTPPKKEKMYAKGGSIDGCAVKGKTKCKIY